MGTVGKGGFFLCVGACACAAVGGGVEYGWVGGGVIVSGVPVRGRVLVPVHCGDIGYACGYFLCGFGGLDGCVVCGAGVPDGMIYDDSGVRAAGVFVLWFGVDWVGCVFT